MSGGSVEIRLADSRDLSELQRISTLTFTETFAAFNSQEDMEKYVKEAFAPSKLLSELSNSESTFFFAFFGKDLAGYLKINTGTAQTETHDTFALEVERIYVLSKFHGKYIGKKLINKAFEVAASKDISTVWLGVWEKNTQAIRFYERNGFTVFGEHIFRLGEDKQRDVLMRKSV